MPSVLVTLVAVAVAAVLLRAALRQLARSEELLGDELLSARAARVKATGDELDRLGGTLRRVRPTASGDGS